MPSSDFVPRFAYIIALSNAQNAVVEFSAAHDYTDGEIISFRVSRPYGMVEINNKQAKVLSHTSTTVTVDLDTLDFNTFIYPAAGQNTPPVCVPAGSGVISTLYTPEYNLEDSFDNIRVN